MRRPTANRFVIQCQCVVPRPPRARFRLAINPIGLIRSRATSHNQIVAREILASIRTLSTGMFTSKLSARSAQKNGPRRFQSRKIETTFPAAPQSPAYPTFSSATAIGPPSSISSFMAMGFVLKIAFGPAGRGRNQFSQATSAAPLGLHLQISGATSGD